VAGGDFITFVNSFNSSDPRFDFNADGIVCGAILLEFGNHFGVTG
jgi:hypothetical protein